MAADAAPQITFDGSTCNYMGPRLIEQGVVEFSLANTNGSEVFAAG